MSMQVMQDYMVLSIAAADFAGVAHTAHQLRNCEQYDGFRPPVECKAQGRATPYCQKHKLMQAHGSLLLLLLSL